MKAHAHAARVASGLVLVCVSIALTGCDPIVDADADAAMGIIDGELRFVSCTTLEEPGTVLGEIRNVDAGRTDWTTFLKADLSSPIESGVPFGAGELPGGSPAEVELAPDLVDGDTIALFVQLPRTASSLHVEFRVPTGGLTSDTWLRPTGEVRSAPCLG